eukprot:12938412-Prorocentrum_lima.AAC.1
MRSKLQGNANARRGDSGKLHQAHEARCGSHKPCVWSCVKKQAAKKRRPRRTAKCNAATGRRGA